MLMIMIAAIELQVQMCLVNRSLCPERAGPAAILRERGLSARRRTNPTVQGQNTARVSWGQHVQ
jgi:hypothetical protein